PLPAKVNRRYSPDIVRSTSTVEQVAHFLKSKHYAIPKLGFTPETGDPQFKFFIEQCTRKYQLMYPASATATVTSADIEMDVDPPRQSVRSSPNETPIPYPL